MNEKMIENALRSLEVPPPDAVRREHALQRAQAGLDVAATAGTPSHRSPLRLVGWAAVPIAAVLAWLMLVPTSLTQQLHAPRTRPGFSTAEVDDSRYILREVRLLFPDRLRAVVVDADGMNIELHDEPTTISDQPILVELSVPEAEPVRLISYSGQTVNATIAGRRMRLDLLLTGGDDVLVLGNDFIWTSHESLGTKGLRIRAQSLDVRS